jgi:uncharacterized protein
LIYVDTSALLKLVRDEAESRALRGYLAADGTPGLVSSALIAIEARHETMRSNPARLPRIDMLLATVTQVEISAAVVESAGRLPDPMLRSLDGIHLATALLVREELSVLLSYDERLLDAAAAHGIPTAAPA